MEELLSILKSLEVFGGVPDDQLKWFLQQSKIIHLKKGAHLFQYNEPVVNTFILLKGTVEINIDMLIGVSDPLILQTGSITGYLPYSRIKVALGRGVVTEDALVLAFPKEKTKDLIHHFFELTQALVSVMTTRVKDTAERQKQNEKMMALGKLSAGLAHELNNPISSIASNAEALSRHIHAMKESFLEILSSEVNVMDLHKAESIILSKSDMQHRKLSILEKSDLEDDLNDWLKDNSINCSLEVAESLADLGIASSDLQNIKNLVGEKKIGSILGWLSNSLTNEKTIKDISEASKRVSELVKSVKAYTHMDQSNTRQHADIHEGIKNTLVILGYKLKKFHIQVIEQYDPAVPKIKIYIGEMNQLWTNLIDNAADAMENSSTRILTVKSSIDKNFVKVTLSDTGIGIPPEMMDKIFDPFFTTKEVGKGTGLGLEVASGIVKKHKGTLKVFSHPGNTTFEVCLPLD